MAQKKHFLVEDEIIFLHSMKYATITLELVTIAFTKRRGFFCEFLSNDYKRE